MAEKIREIMTEMMRNNGREEGHLTDQSKYILTLLNFKFYYLT